MSAITKREKFTDDYGDLLEIILYENGNMLINVAEHNGGDDGDRIEATLYFKAEDRHKIAQLIQLYSGGEGDA